MAETLPAHQLIATDVYWGPTAELPTIPLGDSLIDGFSSVHMFAQFGAAKVQALYRQALNRGYVSTPVQPGEALPLLERGQGLVRIVEDVRKVPVRDPNKTSRLPKIAKNDSPSHFDWLASRMLEEPLYADEIARTTTLDTESEHHARVWRIVSYLTGSKSGSQLEGIASVSVLKSPDSSGFNNLIPPIVVGEAYRRNKAGTIASKVIAAEVLISGGSRRRVPRKSLVTVKPRFAFNG